MRSNGRGRRRLEKKAAEDGAEMGLSEEVLRTGSPGRARHCPKRNRPTDHASAGEANGANGASGGYSSIAFSFLQPLHWHALPCSPTVRLLSPDDGRGPLHYFLHGACSLYFYFRFHQACLSRFSHFLFLYYGLHSSRTHVVGYFMSRYVGPGGGEHPLRHRLLLVACHLASQHSNCQRI
ncbi:hypothetical protein BO78DRAFT_5532 [Aspergillus sclerotiicarbonarius CBS 121057]|uniref:Uncharacterized protein n=1 Tax=Aspergillus sclerotiicarbonarius (strain CBS 121057 / IBT 28362) TaxID=1448318 RepID=A0A319ESV5_ASPSB|nr:hypothetical protein BO78DRAFT_5532 [Aspergillus sclerotiicarbonarius CBS 121057]